MKRLDNPLPRDPEAVRKMREAARNHPPFAGEDMDAMPDEEFVDRLESSLASVIEIGRVISRHLQAVAVGAAEDITKEASEGK